jgi:hypothetical protein
MRYFQDKKAYKMTQSQKYYHRSYFRSLPAHCLIGLGYYTYSIITRPSQSQPLGPCAAGQSTIAATHVDSLPWSRRQRLWDLSRFGATGGHSPQPLHQAICGGPNIMNILLVGADTRGDNYTYGLADAIRVVRVDFSIPKVTMLEFPARPVG